MGNMIVIDGIAFSGTVTQNKNNCVVSVLRGDGYKASFQFVRDFNDEIGCYLAPDFTAPEGCDGKRIQGLLVAVSGVPDWCSESHVMTPRTDRLRECPLPEEDDIVQAIIVAKFFFDMHEMELAKKGRQALTNLCNFMFEKF